MQKLIEKKTKQKKNTTFFSVNIDVHQIQSYTQARVILSILL